MDCLRDFDKSFKIEPSDLSLYPGCYDRKQVAVIRTKGSPDSFRRIKSEASYFMIPGLSTDGVMVDRNFYHLTPLNRPEDGDDMIDVIAVAGLEGHAIESWRNTKSGEMWLQNHLPKDIKNIRILTYGYNTDLIGDTMEDTILDLRSNLFTHLLNVRKTAQEKKRPIIFIGHGFGGILILQTLLESKSRKIYEHILNATRALFFFGVPHQGFRTSKLEARIKDMSRDGDPSAAVMLLEKLRQNSEFLISQRNDLVDIWDKINLYSFYEKVKTPIIVQTASGQCEPKERAEETVQKMSSRLFMPREIAVGVSKTHSEMIRFISDEDPTYITFKRNMEEEVANVLESLEEEKNEPKEFLFKLSEPQTRSLPAPIGYHAGYSFSGFNGTISSVTEHIETESS
ncbi:uncharacterized protein LAJ45_05698 [Morchella importuna]|nr:uncharacterized protein LAJ45_05698 [Morchella importuna]KAH8150012.1 hypothetical protein LAJ45_05698 [Morchella importuna]